MTTDPDPFEQGQRAARQNIPAGANPYQDGSEQHALWAAGHEKSAGEMEAKRVGGDLSRPKLRPLPQPIFFMPFLNCAPLAT